MDSRSEACLAHVHPDLAKVMRAARQAPQAFEVTYGARTLAAEEEAVASGHSETLHSRHLPDAKFGGVAMAVDITCLTGGVVDETVADSTGGIYGDAADQVCAAAELLGVDIQWGGEVEGAWVDGQVSHFRDWGHFQLDPESYP